MVGKVIGFDIVNENLRVLGTSLNPLGIYDTEQFEVSIDDLASHLYKSKYMTYNNSPTSIELYVEGDSLNVEFTYSYWDSFFNAFTTASKKDSISLSDLANALKPYLN